MRRIPVVDIDGRNYFVKKSVARLGGRSHRGAPNHDVSGVGHLQRAGTRLIIGAAQNHAMPCRASLKSGPTV